MPETLQILSCIDRMDKAVTGVCKSYDMLSEIAHPNSCGARHVRKNRLGEIHGAFWSRSAINRRYEEQSAYCLELLTCLSWPTIGYRLGCRNFWPSWIASGPRKRQGQSDRFLHLNYATKSTFDINGLTFVQRS